MTRGRGRGAFRGGRGRGRGTYRGGGFGDAVVAMLPTKEDESSPASDEPDEPGVHHQFVSSVSLSRGILAMELRD